MSYLSPLNIELEVYVSSLMYDGNAKRAFLFAIMASQAFGLCCFFQPYFHAGLCLCLLRQAERKQLRSGQPLLLEFRGKRIKVGSCRNQSLTFRVVSLLATWAYLYSTWPDTSSLVYDHGSNKEILLYFTCCKNQTNNAVSKKSTEQPLSCADMNLYSARMSTATIMRHLSNNNGS